MKATERTCFETHPWIDFKPNLAEAPFTLWMRIGEAQSKCQHISGVPLSPVIAKKFQTIYLSKGVHATTSIEGNTLSVQQVRQLVEGKLDLPKSQAYLATEVRNVTDICHEIARQIRDDTPIRITPELICAYNERVLRGLDHGEGIEPGVIRKISVGVGTYRGAPWEDCGYLLERLCTWLNDEMIAPAEDLRFAYALLKSVIAHLYIAWIHPFGDGNGRTARLVEFLILVQSGVPLPAAHLLSNHYNKTRTRYYAELDRSSKPNVGVTSFVAYAVEGFVDGLAGQLNVVRKHQWKLAWESYVHDQFRDQETAASTRQKHLVLDLPIKPISRHEVPSISVRVGRAYSAKGDKTLTRDINALLKMRLLRKVGTQYVPNRQLILAFLPKRRREQGEPPDQPPL